MEWKELGVNVAISDDMFPFLLMRADGKISLWTSPRWFTFRFFLCPLRKLYRYRYTHMMSIGNPPAKG